jgi:ketosteroid isomerase-like protein
MSRENVEIVRQGLEAINRRDVDVFVACLHPEVEWDNTEGGPGFQRFTAEDRPCDGG